MSSQKLLRLTGLACILGGICVAGFVLVHPWDQLMGAEIARTARWQIAHTLHFAGALFTLFGLLGIFAVQREKLGSFGIVAFVLSFIGNAMFLGTGMITAFIWLMLAVQAPDVVAPGGPILGRPHSVLAFEITAVLVIVGYALFGIAMFRTKVFPKLSILMVGTAFGMLPPHPMAPIPWGALVFGGVVYGVALVWMGWIIFGLESGTI